jgi:phosphomannomutase
MPELFTKKASCKLENELFKRVEERTPDYIKKSKLIDLSNKNAFSFILKREHLYEYDNIKNPEGLGLWDWFKNYEKEAMVSTAGIRGPQNILYPEDTRFPINLMGITLATVAKALVINEKGYKHPTKLVGREVRYNSDLYLETIARIQAAYGIRTLVPEGGKTIPIWLASFLVFKLGLVGGEYITSSHGISVKNATKDLNSQGGQYLPEESMEFVNKIREIFKETEKTGKYKISFSAADDALIDENAMRLLNDGVDLYVDYLRTSVAKKINMGLIENFKGKIVIENVGGSAYKTLNRVLNKLKIQDKFNWFNIEEDPFFHSIGKYDFDSNGKCCFYDYSVDATVISTSRTGEKFFPVIASMNYGKKLEKYPINTVVLITDPDHDRLTVTQIENTANIKKLEEAGIDYVRLSDKRVLTVFSANQAFLMLMDFRSKQLKKIGKWNDYPYFIIKTTASSLAWDEWAKKNGINVINVPVGFKEIANIMKKVETKLAKNPNKEIILTDVLGNKVNLGINPRLLFAGEESGGMIMGPSKLICSDKGCDAIAMREKSATEAIMVASALSAKLELENKTLSQYFKEVIKDNKIKGKFDTRADISYYNESEPDIKKLSEEKKEGEEKRTKNDLFFLTLAIGVNYNIITLKQVKQILNEVFAELDFSRLKEIKFVGDGTYLKFADKFIEIRPSGTDAKTKAYAVGSNKDELEKYTKIMGYFKGERTELYKKLIDEEFYNSAKEKAMEKYLEFVNRD